MPTTPNQPNSLKPFDDEILDVKKQSLYARLKRLFSTDVIVRNVGGKQLKIKDTDSIMYATDRNSLRDRYNRIRSTAFNAYTRDFALSYQAARMDLFRDYDCVGPDTAIPLPDGTRPTIAELAEKYKDRPQERFWVFSYDHETNSVKLGKAYHPRKKQGGVRKAWKVIFDNGQYVVGSAGHPFLMRNGEYKKLEDLSVGESVMPFYQKDFYKNGYRSIYNFSKGWQSEHVIVAEQFERSLNDNEVVHHKDFDKTNNLPSNLQIMTEADHKAFHMYLNNQIIWSPENKQKTITKVQSSDGYKNRKCHKWNGERKGKNNPFYGKSHSEKSNSLRSYSLKKSFETRDQAGSNNPNYRDLTFSHLQNVCKSYYLMFGQLNIHRLAKFMHYDYSTIRRRIEEWGLDWRSFKQQTIASINHKIVSIEYVGEIEVYDVTVEKYQNFATDSCFVHNTMDMDPILSSALDIYADECLTYNEVGKMITVHSNNNNVKRILENLFDEILNVRFNLWSWVRNMVKYGDFYLKLYITPEYGIYMVEPISAYNVERIENSDPSNKRYVKFQLRPTDTSQAEVLENYEVAHFRLISDSNFLPYGKCLTSNSYVETEFGCKRIDELNVGERVWSFSVERRDFELTTIKRTCSSGKKPILKILTKHNQIECSPEHPIFVFSGGPHTGTVRYKQAKNLTMDDLIILSSNKNKKSISVSLSKKLLTNENHNGWQNNIELLPDTVDEDFAEFFGFMLGDGWINTNYNRVSFAAGLDATINDRYTTLLEKYANKSVSVVPRREKGGEQRYVDSKLLSEFLYVNGFKGDALTKRIPSWVYELDEKKQLAFIRGFVNADGSVFTDKWNVNRYQIELNNKQLVEDIKALLNRLNVKCSNIKERGFDGITEICGTTCNRHKSYYIYFYLDGDKKAQEHKYDALNVPSLITVPIEKIEICEEQETYDIQVESENSNFIANGIVVHNSMIEGARRVWKQLSLMEDAMLISRIMRAPERRIFYTDIGNIPPNEVDAYMQKMMDKMKKVPYIDEQTGEYNLRFNLQNMIEDYYIPVRGGDSGTKIDTLAGMEWTGIDDLEYIKTKMMAALKIPKAFLGYEEGISGKATLASEDVRFARTIQRLQRIIASELSKIAIVHLYAQGYRDESLVDFEIELTNPSTIFEKEKIEIWQDKISVAIDMVENKFFSYDWVYKNIFNMSEDDVKEVKEQVVEDSKQKYRLTKIEEDGDDPAKPFKKIGGGKGDDDEDDEGGLGDLDIGGGGGHGGGGGGSLPDLDDLGGDEDEGGKEGDKDKEGEDTDLSDLEKDLPDDLKESTEVPRADDRDRSDRDQSDRDQTGEKKMPAIAEDPIGSLSRHETPKKKSEGKRVSAISHNYEGGSPLRIKEVQKQKPVVDKGMIGSLSEFLKKSHGETKTELLTESNATGNKSMMDPSNILE